MSLATLQKRLSAEIFNMILRATGLQKPELAALARVDKTWYTAVTRFLWSDIDLRYVRSSFLQSVMGSFVEGTVCSGRTFARKLTFPLGFESISASNLLVQNLRLFENLQHLTLSEVFSPDDLAVLFNMHLPSLKVLVVNDDVDKALTDVWDFGLTVDRDRVRAFFAGLSFVDFSNNLMEAPDDTEASLLTDAAHQNLQKIAFPGLVYDEVASRFFASCSVALVEMQSSPGISLKGLQTLADTCTGLRVLCMEALPLCDPILEGLVYLLEHRGPGLVALDLDFDESEDYDHDVSLMESIATNCRSLEFLNLSMEAHAEDIGPLMNLVEACGQSFKYLNLKMHVGESTASEDWLESFIGTIGTCCPELEGLEVLFWYRGQLCSVSEETLAYFLDNVGT
ncbi:hypothetical protein HK102_007119 [Quaeritorhiza haematococci]|nr:hypothetical protein HK102_007119 [Quaeritorhiza haematococci]